MVLELFYRKVDPGRTAAQIHTERMKQPFGQLCEGLQKKYRGVDPQALFESEQHGHDASRPCDMVFTASRIGRDSQLSKKGGADRALEVEACMEEAKRNMRYAFVKPKPLAITRAAINAELVQSGFQGGISQATVEQIEQARLNLILGPRDEMQSNSWVERLFRMKDRDHSHSLAFEEFVAVMRRYGKIPPPHKGRSGPKRVSDNELHAIFRRVCKEGNRRDDGELSPAQFESFLQEPPSRDLRAWRGAAASHTKAPKQKLRVRALGRSELEKLWWAYDWNQNRKLSLAEIDKAIRCHPPVGWAGFENKKALLLAFRAADIDWSGYITRREFEKLLKYVVYFHMLWQSFHEIDTDGDHRLDLSEFKSCCVRLGVGDTDGDGVLSDRELYDAFSSIDSNGGGVHYVR